MVLKTRRPTGQTAWPLVLLAGRESAGKTWAALAASASPMIGRTLYIGAGETDPDEYALIPNADFEIVEHGGTYQELLAACVEAVAAPTVNDLPTLIVFDSGTRLWNLLSDNAQGIANRRAKGQRDPLTADHTITPDLWNSAASQWADPIAVLRAHRGPVIITARLDEVMVMENGQPARGGAKQWKVQAHKSLPFEVDATIEMHTRGHYLLTAVKSARIALERPREVPEFTIEWLWKLLGVTPATAGDRSTSAVVADGRKPSGWRDAVAAAADRPGLNAVASRAQAEGWFDDEVRVALNDRLSALGGPTGVSTPDGADKPVDGRTAPETGVECPVCGEPTATAEGEPCGSCAADVAEAEGAA